ncbi:DUF2119 domain-containing protein [Methanocaldococcus jannaschii]|nr:DUF2119 family protein [Methanocaldococcus jannaschii]
MEIFEFKGNGVKKLFIGGLHGNEGKFTEIILKDFVNSLKECNYIGDIVVIPKLVENSKYISTLSEKYYESDEGKTLINIIKKYKPKVYFELHAYKKENYKKLTSNNRKKVPPLIDIGNNVLIASISPILRKRFSKEDFCMTIEIPSWKVYEVKDEILKILKIGAESLRREEIIEKLKKIYPEHIEKAEYFSKKYNLMLF